MAERPGVSMWENQVRPRERQEQPEPRISLMVNQPSAFDTLKCDSDVVTEA